MRSTRRPLPRARQRSAGALQWLWPSSSIASANAALARLLYRAWLRRGPRASSSVPRMKCSATSVPARLPPELAASCWRPERRFGPGTDGGEDKLTRRYADRALRNDRCASSPSERQAQQGSRRAPLRIDCDGARSSSRAVGGAACCGNGRCSGPQRRPSRSRGKATTAAPSPIDRPDDRAAPPRIVASFEERGLAMPASPRNTNARCFAGAAASRTVQPRTLVA
jgi:hypothetical protein